MTFNFTVSPDFAPDRLSGWYIFNTWLQKQTDSAIHLEIYPDFAAQKAAITSDKIDLIYANPYDAAMLVREKGFLPLVKSAGASDEAILAVHRDNPVIDVEALPSGTRVAHTQDPDVRMIGMIMLEPSNLTSDTLQAINCDTYILVAKNLLQNKADVGIFLAQAYDDLSDLVKKQLKVLVRSQISVIHHSLMIGPKLQEKREEIQNLLINMHGSAKSKEILDSLGFSCWQKVDDEEMEFMIDLMDTLAI